VSTLWLSALLDDEEIVNIAGEHFIQVNLFFPKYAKIIFIGF